MSGPGTGRERRRGIYSRVSAAEDVSREIRAHLDMRAEELEAEGWDPAEAGAEALRRFGDRGAIERVCVRITRSHQRAVSRGRTMGDVWQDVRYAVRGLVRTPGFTAVALVTLALGIGANTAIFSVVNGVLLSPLPYESPDELVAIHERSARGDEWSVAWGNFRDWRSEARSFRAMAAYGAGTTTVRGGGEPVWATVATVSEDFWKVFPVRPVAGRLTVPADHREGAGPVVVVSRAFAREVLGGDDVLGRTVEAWGVRAQVVGVVPSGFAFPPEAEIWTALAPQGESRTGHNWSVVARLAEGVSADAAGREVDALMRRIAATAGADEPSEYLAAGTVTVPLLEELVGSARRPLGILLGAAALVLLVACANLASTLLARGTARAHELAVRSALGARRGRLMSQLLTESAVLALGGAAVGLVVAIGALRVLRAVGSASVPRLENVGVDGTVLAFTLGAALVTALAFGLLPALRSTGRGQAEALRSGARGNAPLQGQVWGVLVATEVALALVLLVGSGLLVRSFVAVLSEDAGFDPGDVALARVAPDNTKYLAPEDHVRFWEDLLARAGAVPGVAAVGLISSEPLAGFVPNGRVSLDGDPTKLADAAYVVASAGTFQALDIPLLQGRGFQESDGPDAPHVVLVSRSFARRYWPGEDPVGKQVSGGGMDDYRNADPIVYGTVVGVVGDVRYRDLTREGEATVYWHYRQRAGRIRGGATLLVEAAGGAPAGLAPAVRATIRRVDPDVAVEPRLMDELVSASVAQRRFLLLVLGGFAGVALILAGVGIYGVVSYAVARRTREMGIRMALGAEPASVRSLVLGRSLRPVFVGLFVGVAGGLGLSRVLRGLLYRVPATDPLTFVAVSGLLLGAAVLATWVPATKGTRVDPITAMQAD